MFLFKTGLSRDINNDSFSCNLKPFFSFKRIEQWSKLNLWPSNSMWSKIEIFLGGVRMGLPVKAVIAKCSQALTKICLWACHHLQLMNFLNTTHFLLVIQFQGFVLTIYGQPGCWKFVYQYSAWWGYWYLQKLFVFQIITRFTT